MPKHTTAFLSLVLALLLLAPMAGQQRTPPPEGKPTGGAPASQAARTAPPREMSVPFRPGETLTYDVGWSTFLTAGTATTSVLEKRPTSSSTAYYIVAEGQPIDLLTRLYKLHYRADTLLDAYTLLPRRGSIVSQEGQRRKTQVTTYDQRARSATYEVQSATRLKRTLRLPAATQDPLSAIYAMRTMTFRPGETLKMTVAEGGELVNVQIAVVGRETVRSGLGTTTAWKLVPSVRDGKGRLETTRRMAMWVSDDERRLPVKMEAELAVGTFTLVLRDARVGAAASH
jgi:hypothetical protein